MARRKRRKSTRRQSEAQYPGWVWMLFGLAIGLSVAFAIYMKDRPAVRETAGTAARPAAGAGAGSDAGAPASMESALDDNGETTAADEPPPQRFDFYDVLPNFEVVIPEQEADVSVDSEPRAIDEPGIYILQAGSFSSREDADRRRAQLALHGIESAIQRVTIDERTYHRVRIGPTRDLDELNVLRSRLRAAKIDALRIRLGD